MSGLGFHPQRVHPSPGCKFIVARPFDHGELPFIAGDAFPYQELGLHEQHAIQLWHACYLDVAPPSQPVDNKPARPTPRR